MEKLANRWHAATDTPLEIPSPRFKEVSKGALLRGFENMNRNSVARNISDVELCRFLEEMDVKAAQRTSHDWKGTEDEPVGG